MHLTPRELDKLTILMLAEVALKRKAKGLKLNHPESVAVISPAALATLLAWYLVPWLLGAAYSF